MGIVFSEFAEFDVPRIVSVIPRNLKAPSLKGTGFGLSPNFLLVISRALDRFVARDGA